MASEISTTDNTNNDSGVDLSALLNALVEKSDGDEVTIATLLDAFGKKTFGPMLLIPAIIAVAPTGAIPGMSIVTGTIVLLVCLQMLIGREHVWLPERITSFSFSRESLKSSVDKALPWAKWLDQYVGRRLTLLATSPVDNLVAVTCVVLALTMYPLALVPFAVAIPGSAIALFALGLTLTDGALISAGYGLAAGAGYAVFLLL